MRRPVATRLLALAIIVLGSTAACSDDEPAAPPSTTAPAEVDLSALALAVDDLPSGFAASTDIDDTITAFCVNEDATAGLTASGREVRGFTRSPAGASVIQLVFRFEDDGAATFVAQARAILDRCSGVPDVTGLAFDYEQLGAELEEPIASVSDDHVGRHGTSVGSGNLTIDVMAFRHGDIGQLVAVLGLDLPRAELDDLAAATFSAVAARAQAEVE